MRERRPRIKISRREEIVKETIYKGKKENKE